jgi:hypothetical protein
MGLETATFRLVSLCFNQYATSCHHQVYDKKIKDSANLVLVFCVHMKVAVLWHEMSYASPDIYQNVRFEVFTAVTMKNGVFWDVTPCGSCKNRRFGGT